MFNPVCPIILFHIISLKLWAYIMSSLLQICYLLQQFNNSDTCFSCRQQYLKTSWPESTSDRSMSAKIVPSFAARGCHKISVTDLYSCILGFLERSRYFFFQVAPQLYSQGWDDSVPNPLLLRISGSAGNRTQTSGSVTRKSDHQTTKAVPISVHSSWYVDPFIVRCGLLRPSY
jgi:hypothetical protein